MFNFLPIHTEDPSSTTPQLLPLLGLDQLLDELEANGGGALSAECNNNKLPACLVADDAVGDALVAAANAAFRAELDAALQRAATAGEDAVDQRRRFDDRMAKAHALYASICTFAQGAEIFGGFLKFRFFWA